ncbi:glycosyltransferase family 61 protein, partial [Candidatus Dependentiae bacterium]|nr:glycosyltransferase family 61 protein [Candidatus Dependentiae bacterium]
TFILKIPNGQVATISGYVKIDNTILEESLIPLGNLYSHQLWLSNSQKAFQNCKKIHGKVAVITIINDCCYGHWLLNVLTRLALLEMYGIEYDYLYVAHDKKYMKETLALWGINPNKIIQPFGETTFIQADELIMPCHLGVVKAESWQYKAPYIPFERYDKIIADLNCYKFPGFYKNPDDFIPLSIPLRNLIFRQYPCCNQLFYKKDALEYIATKYIHLAQKNIHKNFSKKIFISRQDIKNRQIDNEDEIFKLFQVFGFERYKLASLSYLEQVALFYNADIIIGTHGSGLANIIYCKPSVTIIEIFQKLFCTDFYNLSQILQFQNYIPIKTQHFGILDHQNYPIDIQIIKDFINTHKDKL